MEAQIESSENENPGKHSDKSAAGMEREHLRKSLLLSRTRVLRDIEGCQNPRYKELLLEALADLDRKLGNLE